jgi:glycosyltransferase 2 family protein
MSIRSSWRFAWLALRIVLSGGLLAFLVWQANPATIWAAWRQADLRLLGVAVLFQFGCVGISAYKSGMLLSALGHPQPYPWMLGVFLVGQFANNFLPTAVGGDAMRVVLIGRRIGGYAEASASVFMERLTGFLALSTIAGIALLLTTTNLFGAPLVNAPGLAFTAATFAVGAVGVAGMAFAAPWVLPRFAYLLPKLVSKPLARIVATLGIFSDDRATMIRVMAISFVYHCAWIGMHVMSGLALGIAAPIMIYFLIVPLTDIVGLAPIFVNNVGARDLVFTLYLRQLGVPDAQALALAFTAFSIRLVVSALGGLVMLFGGADMRVRETPTPPDKLPV